MGSFSFSRIVALFSLVAAASAGSIRKLIPMAVRFPNEGHVKKLGFFFRLDSGLPKSNFIKIKHPKNLDFKPKRAYFEWFDLNQTHQFNAVTE